MENNNIPDRLQKQLDFIKEIDKEKEIERRTLLSDGSRFENDAEHAWHMAVMAILLSEYANEEIDILKTVSMILIHDIVEIDSGDTYCYDEDGKKTQEEREKKAANRLFNLLPEDQAQKFYALWREFEEKKNTRGKICKDYGLRSAHNAQCCLRRSYVEEKRYKAQPDFGEKQIHRKRLKRTLELSAESSHSS